MNDTDRLIRVEKACMEQATMIEELKKTCRESEKEVFENISEIEQRIDTLEIRFDALRFDVDANLQNTYGKIEQLEQRIEQETDLRNEMDDRLHNLYRQVVRLTERVINYGRIQNTVENFEQCKDWLDAQTKSLNPLPDGVEDMLKEEMAKAKGGQDVLDRGNVSDRDDRGCSDSEGGDRRDALKDVREKVKAEQHAKHCETMRKQAEASLAQAEKDFKTMAQRAQEAESRLSHSGRD